MSAIRFLLGAIPGVTFLYLAAVVGLSGTRPSFAPTSAETEALVVQKLRASDELTTAILSLQSVIKVSSDNEVFNFPVGTTEILYIGYGEIRAGIELSAIAISNVTSADGVVTVVLPAPEILDSKIDVSRSGVASYDRSWLSPDKVVELTEYAQRKALREMIEQSCGQGILEEANKKGAIAIQGLLSSTGLTVVVETQEPDLTGCREVKE